MNFAETPPVTGELSERELEIALLIAEGLTEKEIASRCFLSKHTVHTHHKNIFRKLGVHNIAAMVLGLFRRGLLKGNQAP